MRIREREKLAINEPRHLRKQTGHQPERHCLPARVWEGGDEKLFIHSKSCETFPENRKLPSGSNSLVFQLNLGLLPDLSSG